MEGEDGPPSPHLMVTWLECADEDGNVYYYNQETQESSWVLPREAEVVAFEVVAESHKPKLAQEIERARTLDHLFSLQKPVQNKTKRSNELAGTTGQYDQHYEHQQHQSPFDLQNGDASAAAPLDESTAATAAAAAPIEEEEEERDGAKEMNDAASSASGASASSSAATASSSSSSSISSKDSDDGKTAQLVEAEQTILELREENQQLIESNERLLADMKEFKVKQAKEKWDQRQAFEELEAQFQEFRDKSAKLDQANDAEMGKLKATIASLESDLRSKQTDMAALEELCQRERKHAEKRHEMLSNLNQTEIDRRVAEKEQDLVKELGDFWRQKVCSIVEKYPADSGPSGQAAEILRDLRALANYDKPIVFATDSPVGAESATQKRERHQLEAMDSQIRVLNKQAEERQEQIGRLLSEKEELLETIGNLSSGDQGGSMEGSGLRVELSGLQNKLVKERASNREISERAQASAQQVATLQTQLDETSSALRKAQERVAELEAQLGGTDAQEKIQQLEMQVQELTDELDKQKRCVEQAERDAQVAQMEADSLHDSATQALREVGHAQSHAQQFEQELANERKKWQSERGAMLAEQALLKSQVENLTADTSVVRLGRADVEKMALRVAVEKAGVQSLRDHVRSCFAQLDSEIAKVRSGLKRLRNSSVVVEKAGIPFSPTRFGDMELVPDVPETLEQVQVVAAAVAPLRCEASAAIERREEDEQKGERLEPIAVPRVVKRYCRVHPKKCHVMDSSLLMADQTGIELCNQSGRTKRWKLHGLVDAHAKNKELFNRVNLLPYCFSTSLESTFCGILIGDASAQPLASLVGSRLNPGLIAQCLYGLVQTIGFSKHSLEYELVTFPSNGSRADPVFRESALTLKSLYGAQLFVEKLEIQGEDAFLQRSRKAKSPTAAAANAKRSGKRKKKHPVKKQPPPPLTIDNSNGCTAEAAHGSSIVNVANHRLYTIFVDKVPRVQFLVLGQSQGGGNNSRYAWSSNQEQTGASEGEISTVVARLQQTTQSWLKYGSVAIAMLEQDALLSHMYYLHTSAAEVGIISHITPTLAHSSHSCNSLNQAEKY